MKTLIVKKEDVKHRIPYGILGLFTYIFSVGFATSVWDDTFFERHKWLTRKNLLQHLQKPHKIKYYKYSFNNDINLTLEDGSEITLWITKDGIFRDWSYHKKGSCVLSAGLSLSTKIIDKQIKEILEGIRKKIRKQEKNG
jgi:hypothetical protein